MVYDNVWILVRGIGRSMRLHRIDVVGLSPGEVPPRADEKNKNS